MSFTSISAPPPPRLEKLFVSPVSITIAWYPPDPPFGLIDEYTIRYWKQGQKDDTVDSRTFYSAGNHTYDKLTTNATYVFEVIIIFNF